MKKVKIVKIAAAVLMAVGGCFALFGSEAWAASVCSFTYDSQATCTYYAMKKYKKFSDCSGYASKSDDVKKCADALKKKGTVSWGSVPDAAQASFYTEMAKGYLTCRSMLDSSDMDLKDCVQDHTNGLVGTATGGDPQDGGGNGDEDEGDEDNPDIPKAKDLKEGEKTSILKSDMKVMDILKFVMNLMTGAVIVAGTVGIILCGYTWMTARDNEAQVTKAKTRMIEIIIGLVAWVLFDVMIQFIFPNTTEVYTGTIVSTNIIEEKK